MLIKSKYSSCICKMVMNTQWSLQTWEDVIVQHTLHADSLWYEVNGLHHYGYSDIIDMHTCTTSNDTHPLSLIHTQTCQPMSYICPNTNILSRIHTHTHLLSLIHTHFSLCHTYVQTQTHCHAYTHTHQPMSYICPNTNILSSTHTHVNPCHTYVQTQTYCQAYTHTHTLFLFGFGKPCKKNSKLNCTKCHKLDTIMLKIMLKFGATERS